MDEKKEEIKPVEKPKPKRTRKPKSGKTPGSKVLMIETGIFVLSFD
jgi:hypothetical protein